MHSSRSANHLVAPGSGCPSPRLRASMEMKTVQNDALHAINNIDHEVHELQERLASLTREKREWQALVAQEVAKTAGVEYLPPPPKGLQLAMERSNSFRNYQSGEVSPSAGACAANLSVCSSPSPPATGAPIVTPGRPNGPSRFSIETTRASYIAAPASGPAVPPGVTARPMASSVYLCNSPSPSTYGRFSVDDRSAHNSNNKIAPLAAGTVASRASLQFNRSSSRLSIETKQHPRQPIPAYDPHTSRRKLTLYVNNDAAGSAGSLGASPGSPALATQRSRKSGHYSRMSLEATSPAGSPQAHATLCAANGISPTLPQHHILASAAPRSTASACHSLPGMVPESNARSTSLELNKVVKDSAKSEPAAGQSYSPTFNPVKLRSAHVTSTVACSDDVDADLIPVKSGKSEGLITKMKGFFKKRPVAS